MRIYHCVHGIQPVCMSRSRKIPQAKAEELRNEWNSASKSSGVHMLTCRCKLNTVTFLQEYFRHNIYHKLQRRSQYGLVMCPDPTKDTPKISLIELLWHLQGFSINYYTLALLCGAYFISSVF